MKRKGLANKKSILWILIGIIFLFYIFLRFVWGDLLIFHKLYDPFGSAFNYIQDKVNKPIEYARTVADLSEENNELKKRLNEYDLLMQNHEEVIEENKRLKKLLGTKNISGFSKKLGVVIGHTPDIWHQEIIIDIGSKDGVKLNDAVISSWGLVGKVKLANENNSVVQLVIDSSNWVSCRNNRSRDIGMLKVEDNKIGKLSYLVNKSDFKVNDLVVTSGLGGIYPKDIPVGIITNVIKKSGDDIPEIDVSLLTDFSDLEEVLVLIKNEN